MQSHLQSKSAEFSSAAELLHNSKLYSAVAHSAYYSCFQLMLHVWLHSLNKTEPQLKQERKQHNQQVRLSGGKEVGSHEFLINKIGKHIKKSARNDFLEISEKIGQLKKLRTSADYDDTLFDSSKSSKALALSKTIIPVLAKY
jgi:uncharacterized protein (UPF0332 family)